MKFIGRGVAKFCEMVNLRDGIGLQLNKQRRHLASKYWLSGAFSLFHSLRENEWWRRGGTVGFHGKRDMDLLDKIGVKTGMATIAINSLFQSKFVFMAIVDCTNESAGWAANVTQPALYTNSQKL